MLRFEVAYQPWLAALATLPPDADAFRAALKQFIETLESLRSVYPEATLHDCDDGDDANPVLLNRTILGSRSEPGG